MSSPDSPQFEVSLVPLTADDVAKVTEWICEDLESIHIDDVRYTMMHASRPRPADQKSAGHHRGTMAGPHFEPHVTVDSTALVFHYYWNYASLAVQILPDHFDRTDPRQDALFEKCIGIIEVLRDGPIKPNRKDYDWLSIRNFRFRRNKSEEEARAWARLVDAWKGHK